MIHVIPSSQMPLHCARLGWDGRGDPKAWYLRLVQAMNEFKGPRRQRGSLAAFPAGTTGAAAGGPAFGLTGTPETIDSVEEDGFTITSNFYVDRDGDLRKREETRGSFFTSTFGSYSNGNNSNASFGDDYHIRVNETSGGAYSSGAGLATWLQMNTDRQWNFSESAGGPSQQISTYDVLFSDDGGTSTLDSFVLTIDNDWDSP
jgi:hypothetical protein